MYIFTLVFLIVFKVGPIPVYAHFDQFLHFIDDLRQSEEFFVQPRIYEVTQRRKRDLNSRVFYEEEQNAKIIEIGKWVIDLNENSLQLAPHLHAEWVSSNRVRKNPIENCEHKRGVVQGLKDTSAAAITLCGSEITGFWVIPKAIFLIQPFNTTHIVRKSSIGEYKGRGKRAMDDDITLGTSSWEYFNLTGDTFELDIDEEDVDDHTNDVIAEEDLNNRVDFNDNLNTTRKLIKEQDPEDDGYFVDTAWETDISRGRGKGGSFHTTPNRWLEIAIGVDHTVVSFHGKERVEHYVLALMNIVSAIYQDASLDANMQLVVTRLLLYENKRQSVVLPGYAKKSLENANNWNRRLHIGLAPGEPRHDIAIYLTRSDIGGPSGYAPVDGTCDPKRSCALNRDEGLTSAFIVAHEMGHILGLSHDGDKKARNDCEEATYSGSVMAPMVSATFNNFFWSECSRREFEKKSKKWTCLNNPPTTEETILNATVDSAFTMDEQCRMEFGEGYELCRAFDIVEPCSHLWCGHVKSPLVCKSKKGPPLDGTECGYDKWCINGYCVLVDKRKFSFAPVVNNPQDGEWSEWSPWGPCSISLGTGVQFRTRKCDNPPSAYGGKNCAGAAEEWRICNKKKNFEPLADLRAEQCTNVAKLLNLRGKKANMTWLPYESDDVNTKCQLICVSKETRELFVTGENLIDGTPCSYENTSDICIQGTCHPLGCDGELFSKVKADSCGICGGNNSDCNNIRKIFSKRVKKEVTRVAVIPKLSRQISIEANLSVQYTSNPMAAFILKDRMKTKYSIPIPNAGIHAEIIEGAKFYYKKVKNYHKIWAKGPILVEMIVLLYAPKSEINTGLNISLRAEYFLRKDVSNDSNRYKWMLGGWGPCSSSCGGGRKQKTVACWDDQEQKIVKRRFCSLSQKPALATEKCNTFSCEFHWITGEWEPCTTTCGSYGTQSRELYCVPQNIYTSVIQSHNNGSSIEAPWRFMVSPNRCAGIHPMITRPCYRIPCASFWQFGEWSQCSTSCGPGISMRYSNCPPPEGESFFSCGPAPLPQRRVCRGPFTRRTNPLCEGKARKRCIGDQSRYCSLPTLAKYCSLRGFRRLCCKACSSLALFPYSA